MPNISIRLSKVLEFYIYFILPFWQLNCPSTRFRKICNTNLIWSILMNWIALQIRKSENFDFSIHCIYSVATPQEGGLYLMKWFSGWLQNLAYFWNTKSSIVFFYFHIFFIWILGFCRHSPRRAVVPGHSLEKK